MKTTRKKTRKVWLRVCKAQGYLSNGNRKLRFVHYKRLSNMGLTVPARAVLGLLATSQDEFFKSRCMTVVHPVSGTTWIITPWRIGKGGPPKRQLEVLAHELQHFFDFEGKLSIVVSYLTDGDFRAWMEAKGEAAGADIIRLFKGPAIAATAIFDEGWQDVYMSSPDEAELAQDHYDAFISAHEAGLYATRAGRIVVKAVVAVCK